MEMENDVFDNGLHQRPKIHSSPFKALLIYMPGALLRNGTGHVPADRPEVTDNNHLSFAAYYALCGILRPLRATVTTLLVVCQ
jgi:hypothetical protein